LITAIIHRKMRKGFVFIGIFFSILSMILPYFYRNDAAGVSNIVPGILQKSYLLHVEIWLYPFVISILQCFGWSLLFFEKAEIKPWQNSMIIVYVVSIVYIGLSIYADLYSPHAGMVTLIVNHSVLLLSFLIKLRKA
jgi:hypothetical protein